MPDSLKQEEKELDRMMDEYLYKEEDEEFYHAEFDSVGDYIDNMEEHNEITSEDAHPV